MFDFWGVLFIHYGLCSLDGCFFRETCQAMSLLQEFRNCTLAFPKRLEGGIHQGFHHGSVENGKKFDLASYQVVFKQTHVAHPRGE